jgi:dUTP pyrophosphatase
MFRNPENVNAYPYEILVEMFYASRELPLPCLALSPEAKLPTKENLDDFGWDIYPDHVVTVGRDVVPIHTGLAMAIPPGYGAFVKERSGLARKYGVKLEGVRLLYDVDVWEDVSGGVIDSGYRGPLVGLFSMRPGYPDRTFSPADKVAQLVILPAPRFKPFWVPELPPSSRGESGFGDSGGVGVPLEPKPSLGSLGASVSVTEPDPCPYADHAWKPILEGPREPKGGLKSRCIPERPYEGSDVFPIRWENHPEEIPTVTTGKLEVTTEEIILDGLEDYHTVNAGLSVQDMEAAKDSSEDSDRKIAMERFKAWLDDIPNRTIETDGGACFVF